MGLQGPQGATGPQTSRTPKSNREDLYTFWTYCNKLLS
jgi:hypothetical protein